MWTKFWFFDAPAWMWQCPDDLLDAFNLPRPPDPNLAWAQAANDAPWRLWRKF